MKRSTRVQISQWPALVALLAMAGLVGCGAADPQSAPAAERDALVAGPVHEMRSAADDQTPTVGSATMDDVAYLAQIGLMRGHLWVGHQLYLNDLDDLAATHMKHPEAELYSTLVDAFESRAVPGFAPALAELGERVSTGLAKPEVQSAYDALLERIALNEAAVEDASAPVIGKVIVRLLQTAAQEYAVGVIDGEINNVHEYQDALGFTQVARQWAANPVFAQQPRTQALAVFIQASLEALLPMWPELAPAAGVPFNALQIDEAAASIERRVLDLQ